MQKCTKDLTELCFSIHWGYCRGRALILRHLFDRCNVLSPVYEMILLISVLWSTEKACRSTEFIFHGTDLIATAVAMGSEVRSALQRHTPTVVKEFCIDEFRLSWLGCAYNAPNSKQRDEGGRNVWLYIHIFNYRDVKTWNKYNSMNMEDTLRYNYMKLPRILNWNGTEKSHLCFFGHQMLLH